MNDKTNAFETLELNVETLRELTDDQLSRVAGGAVTTIQCIAISGGAICKTTEFVPSGSQWTMICPTDACGTG